MRILLIYVEILQVFLFNYIYLSVFVWRCVQVSTDACLEKPKKRRKKQKSNQNKNQSPEGSYSNLGHNENFTTGEVRIPAGGKGCS